jgi:cysteine synthase A
MMVFADQQLKTIARMVGNTPLLCLKFFYRGQERTIYAKAEYGNLTGSIKDRMALHILSQAYEDGSLRAGDTIAEATSGNTGISFAAMGGIMGNPVTIFMPDWMSQERIALMKSYGANVVLVSKVQGGFLGSIKMAEEMAEKNKSVFLPRQFANAGNAQAHEETTGPEIWMQAENARLHINAFVAGVGTGGTVMGVGKYLRAQDPKIKVHPVEPAESPTLTTGHKVGKHRIQGISDEFIPEIVKLNELDEVIAISDGDAILMAQKLALNLGLGVGISSGCNFLAALKAQEKYGPKAVVVTVFCDDNRKYLSTDLVKTEPVKAGYLSTEVELTGFSTVGRVCQVCFEQNNFVPAKTLQVQ